MVFFVTGKSRRICSSISLMIISYHFYKKIQVGSRQILSTRGLNTLMFNDPYAKLCCTSIFASEFDRVIYVDLNTTFTAYFMAGLVSTSNVDICLPSEGRFTPMIKDVIA